MALVSTLYQMTRKGMLPGGLFLPRSSLPVLWGKSPRTAWTQQNHIREQMWRLSGCNICHRDCQDCLEWLCLLWWEWGLLQHYSIFPQRGNPFPFKGVQRLQRLSLDFPLLFSNHFMDASAWPSDGFPNAASACKWDDKCPCAIWKVSRLEGWWVRALCNTQPIFLPISNTILISARADGRQAPEVGGWCSNLLMKFDSSKIKSTNAAPRKQRRKTYAPFPRPFSCYWCFLLESWTIR